MQLATLNQHTKPIGLVVSASIVLTLLITLQFISSEELVQKIGVENSYIAIFFISLVGGISTGGFLTYISSLITLIQGGIPFLYLGIISGLALGIGDTFLYYVFVHVRNFVPQAIYRRINWVAKYIQSHTTLMRALPLLIFIYFAFVPLPNDFGLIALAIIHYPFKKMVPLLLAADLTFAVTFSYLIAAGLIGVS